MLSNLQIKIIEIQQEPNLFDINLQIKIYLNLCLKL